MRSNLDSLPKNTFRQIEDIILSVDHVNDKVLEENGLIDKKKPATGRLILDENYGKKLDPALNNSATTKASRRHMSDAYTAI